MSCNPLYSIHAMGKANYLACAQLFSVKLFSNVFRFCNSNGWPAWNQIITYEAMNEVEATISCFLDLKTTHKFNNSVTRSDNMKYKFNSIEFSSEKKKKRSDVMPKHFPT